MFLIYGRPGHSACLLVRWNPASTKPQEAYWVVNGCYHLQEVELGHPDRLWLSDVDLSKNVSDRAYHRGPEGIYVLQMEWGPTMTPRDNRAKLADRGRWDYNEVLQAARQLLAGSPVMTWQDRLDADAATRNPPPGDWDPDALIRGY